MLTQSLTERRLICCYSGARFSISRFFSNYCSLPLLWLSFAHVFAFLKLINTWRADGCVARAELYNVHTNNIIAIAKAATPSKSFPYNLAHTHALIRRHNTFASAQPLIVYVRVYVRMPGSWRLCRERHTYGI